MSNWELVSASEISTFQLINFAFVSPHNRVVYVGITTYFWLNILCVFKRIDMNSDVFKQGKP